MTLTTEFWVGFITGSGFVVILVISVFLGYTMAMNEMEDDD